MKTGRFCQLKASWRRCLTEPNTVSQMNWGRDFLCDRFITLIVPEGARHNINTFKKQTEMQVAIVMLWMSNLAYCCENVEKGGEKCFCALRNHQKRRAKNDLKTERHKESREIKDKLADQMFSWGERITCGENTWLSSVWQVYQELLLLLQIFR